MHLPQRHWLDFDPVALAVLVIGMAMIYTLISISSDLRHSAPPSSGAFSSQWPAPTLFSLTSRASST
jgi:hypothetical protein